MMKNSEGLSVLAGLTPRNNKGPYITLLIMVLVAFLTRYLISVIVINYLPLNRFNPVNSRFIVTAPKSSVSNNVGVEWDVSKLWKWWDSSFYLSISLNGYEKRAFTSDRYSNWGFYPLYPVLVALVSRVLGLSTEASIFYTGVALSTVFLYLSLVIIFKLCTRLKFSSKNSYIVTTLILLTPGGHFFNFFYTESLFLLLSACTLYFLFEKRYLLSAIMFSLCLVTRFNSFLLYLPIFYYIYSLRKDFTTSKLISILVLFGLSPLSCLAFYYYLYTITGNFFAYLEIQQLMWHSGFKPFDYFVRFLQNFGLGSILHVLILVAGYVVLIFTGIKIWKLKQTEETKIEYKALWIYTFFSILFYSGLSEGSSIQRFISTLFPLYLLPIPFIMRGKHGYMSVIFATLLLAVMQTLFLIFYLVNAYVYSY